MVSGRAAWLGAVLSALVLLGCQPANGPAAVNAARLTAADKDPGDWMSQGRTYGEQRFSPLTQVNTTNVGIWAWPGASSFPPTAGSK